MQPGETIRHPVHGDCLYDEECHQLEKMCGGADSVFVVIDGEVKQVSVMLIQRFSGKQWVRMNPLTHDLDTKIQTALFLCDSQDEYRLDPNGMIGAIRSRCWNFRGIDGLE